MQRLVRNSITAVPVHRMVGEHGRATGDETTKPERQEMELWAPSLQLC
jgi:hypothetical protein